MRTRLFLSLVAVSLLVAGCGGGGKGGSNFPTGQGGAAPAAASQPTLFAAATGPVNSQAQATERILQRYLFQAFGVNAQGDLDPRPPVKAYKVPPGLVAAGTLIGTLDTDLAPYRLTGPAYLFWVDPSPLLKKGHPSRIVYLLANDGTILEQVVDFQPTVGRESPLRLSSQQQENLIYEHPEFATTALALRMAADEQLAPILTRDEVLGQLAGGGRVVGASLIAAEDISANNDANAARRLFQSMGGQNVDFFPVFDDPENDNPFPPTLDLALADARAAAAGLGPDDKFFLHISSHGTKSGKLLLGVTPIGLDSEGNLVHSLVRWQDLCKWIDDNIPAGNINLVLDTCYSGLAVCAFDEWAATSDKRVRVLAATDKEHQSFSSPFGTGYATACITRMLVDRIRQLQGSAAAPTLDQVEQAFFEFDLTKEHVLEKICRITELAISLGGQVRFNNLSKAKWEEMTGVPAEGGFDNRPDPAPPTPTPTPTVTPTPGSGTTIRVDTFPGEGVVNQPLDPDISVSVRDGQGLLVANVPTRIELILGPPPGGTLPPGAAFVGTTTRTTINGVATFPNLSVNQEGSFQVTVRAPELSAEEVAQLLVRVSNTAPSNDVLISVVDRQGRIFGILSDTGPQPPTRISNSAAQLTLGLGMTRNTNQNEILIADFQGNSINFYGSADSLTPPSPPVGRGPGIVAPIALSNDPFRNRLYAGLAAPQVDLFEIEATNRDAVNPIPNPLTPRGSITGFPAAVTGLASDVDNDRLFVALDNGVIDVFDNASTTNGTRAATVDRSITATGLTHARGLFYEPVTRQLFVAESGPPGAIFSFTNPGAANGLTAPATHLTGGISNPFGVYVHRERLFVTNIGTNTVTVHDRAASVTGPAVPAFVINGLDQPQGIVVLDPAP